MAINMSAATAPPKRTTRASATPAVPAKSARDLRAEGLNNLGQLAQGLCLMTHQYADAATIGMHWGGIAPELASLADQYEVLAKPIDLLIQVGPFGALIAAAMPMVTQILANHRIVDATKMVGSSVVPPEVLESRMKANIAQMQAQAMRDQQQAVREAQKAQAEYEQMMAESNLPANGAGE